MRARFINEGCGLVIALSLLASSALASDCDDTHEKVSKFVGNLERLLKTGKCPRCGERVLDEGA